MIEIFQCNVKVVTGLYDAMKDIGAPSPTTLTLFMGIVNLPGTAAMDNAFINSTFFESPLFIGVTAGTGVLAIFGIAGIAYCCIKCSADSTAPFPSDGASEERLLGSENEEDSDFSRSECLSVPPHT